MRQKYSANRKTLLRREAIDMPIGTEADGGVLSCLTITGNCLLQIGGTGRVSDEIPDFVSNEILRIENFYSL